MPCGSLTNRVSLATLSNLRNLTTDWCTFRMLADVGQKMVRRLIDFFSHGTDFGQPNSPRQAMLLDCILQVGCM